MRRWTDRLYLLLVWSTGASLVTAGGALLVLMLATVVGPFRFGALDAENARRAIGLWLPQAAAPPVPPEVARRAEAWRRLARRDEPIVESIRLSELVAAGVRLVILPDARRLDRQQLYLLRRYLADGGGLVLTGSLGVRSPDGRWLGYELMQEILDVPSVTPLDRRRSDSISAFARGPLSAGLGPSQTVLLRGEPGVPAIEAAAAELRWTHPGTGPAVGASRRLRIGRGRLVWLAAGPEVVFEAQDRQRASLEKIMRNALAWAHRRPTLEVLPWPGRAAFAAEVVRSDTAAPEAPERFEREFEAVIAKAARSGDYLQVGVPVAGLSAEQTRALVGRLRARLTQHDAWLATRDQERAWSLARAAVGVSMRRVGPRRLLINVTSHHHRTIEGVGLQLWLNQPLVWARLDRTTLLQEIPQLRYRPGAETMGISLPPLKPGTSRSYYIDFELRDSSDAA